MKKLKLRLIKVNWKLLRNIAYWLLIVVLVVIAAVTAISALDIPGGIKLYAVQSGSMEPAISAGSLVLSKPTEGYQIGNIITFKAEEDRLINNPKYTITHRVFEVNETETGIEYVTKGDANDTRDSRAVSKDLVLGKTIFSIPFLGYPISYAKTREGLIILVIIPATMIIYSEMLNIKKEFKRLIREKKKRKLTAVEKAEVVIGIEAGKTEKDIKRFFKRVKNK